MWEAEIEGLQFQANVGEKVCETPIPMEKTRHSDMHQ
jgi:hypothetical protein